MYCYQTYVNNAHLESAVLPRPQVVFEQPKGVQAARLTFAAVSIMGVL